MKRLVTGIAIKTNGTLRFPPPVFYKECHSIEEMRQAIDDAFEKGATKVIIAKAEK